MPLIADADRCLRWNGYRFFFWSGDRGEPPHVHVKKGAAEAKVWLDPVALATAVDLRTPRDQLDPAQGARATVGVLKGLA